MGFSELWDSIFLATIILSTICIKSEQASDNPRIRLASFIEVDDSNAEVQSADLKFQTEHKYNTDFIYKNGSEYIVLSDVRVVTFACEADYPVRWTVPYPQQFKKIRDYNLQAHGFRASHFNDEWDEPIDGEYSAELRLTVSRYEFLGGDFICEGIPHPTLQDRIYLFTEGEVGIQSKDSETIHVNTSTSESNLILPCRPALPSYQVSLFKSKILSPNETEWLPISMLLNVISFDPRKGFTLDKSTFGDVIGTYKCVVNDEAEMRVLINVEAGDNEPSKAASQFQSKEVFKLDDGRVSGDKGHLECCSGKSNTPPRGHYAGCKTEQQCDILGDILTSDIALGEEVLPDTTPYYGDKKDCFVSDSYDNAGHLICKSDEVDVATQFLHVFTHDEKYNDSDDGHRTWQWILVHKLRLLDLSKSKPLVEEKICFSVAKPLMNPKLEDKSGSDVIYALHTDEGSTIYSSDPVEWGGKRGVVYLKHHHDGDIFEGEHIYVICYNLRFYYSNGAWLRLNWKNGTKDILTYDSNADQVEVAYMGVVDEKQNTIVAIIPEVDLGMKGVECYVPVWNSRRWEHREFKLNVKPAVIPKLAGNEHEKFELHSNDSLVDVQLNCTIVEGKPLPKLSWEKDGLPIDWNTSFNSSLVLTFGNASTMSVNFLKVLPEIEGIYTCIAENKGGRVTKNFKIALAGSGQMSEYSGISIVATVAAVVSLGTLLLGLGFLGWKYQVFRLTR